jgi:hypothetical protein
VSESAGATAPQAQPHEIPGGAEAAEPSSPSEAPAVQPPAAPAEAGDLEDPFRDDPVTPDVDAGAFDVGRPSRRGRSTSLPEYRRRQTSPRPDAAELGSVQPAILTVPEAADPLGDDPLADDAADPQATAAGRPGAELGGHQTPPPWAAVEASALPQAVAEAAAGNPLRLHASARRTQPVLAPARHARVVQSPALSPVATSRNGNPLRQ